MTVPPSPVHANRPIPPHPAPVAPASAAPVHPAAASPAPRQQETTAAKPAAAAPVHTTSPATSKKAALATLKQDVENYRTNVAAIHQRNSAQLLALVDRAAALAD